MNLEPGSASLMRMISGSCIANELLIALIRSGQVAPIRTRSCREKLSSFSGLGRSDRMSADRWCSRLCDVTSRLVDQPDAYFRADLLQGMACSLAQVTKSREF